MWFPGLRTQRKVLRKHYKRNARFMQATQGPKHALQEKQKVLIWHKPYHMTNSSQVIGQFLRTLHA